ncbi:hypothetical protein [Bradyrhizobium sp. WYCCWR 12699]|uniref:hypothetical protein n=1 Tax=Bradyrhizobium sp. WYCCWR 12699 TaxID=3064203 RepID=UPI0028A36F18|nr:hypothetical protein [Bradyrhizobium sp. WYCCWR 12699]MDT4740668.1 hypothetical protein [Bradyrhizobium sp. WYCCWR 12699]
MAKSHYSRFAVPVPVLCVPRHFGQPRDHSRQARVLPGHAGDRGVVHAPPYVLKDGAVMYIGESMDCSRRLRDHGATNATLRKSELFPTTTSID